MLSQYCSNNKFKEIDIKNRTCYYFDDIIHINHTDLDNISIDERSYQNIQFMMLHTKIIRKQAIFLIK